MSNEERLHKFIAEAGICSRRKAEELIALGRVSVNGKVISKMGVKIDPSKDVVHVDGRMIETQKKVYFMLNKPAGYITTDEENERRPRAVDLIKIRGVKVRAAGRLDMDAEGLIIFTNDGEFINRICHPSKEIKKTYAVYVKGRLDPENIKTLMKGVFIIGGMAKADEVKIISSARTHSKAVIVLHEGRNHIVKRMFDAVGHPVTKLIRVQIGSIRLGTLRKGCCRKLTAEEIKSF